MKTIEVSDHIAKVIDAAAEEGVASVLSRMAQEFIDVSSISTPPGRKELVHALTGKRLTIRADWSD